VKKVLVIWLLLVALGMSCGGGGGESNGDSAAIEDTIRGYVETYNARDYVQCLTYFTDYGDEDEALASLEFFRGLSGELGFQEIIDIDISGRTAMVTVAFTIGGEEGTDQMELKKVDGRWKTVW